MLKTIFSNLPRFETRSLTQWKYGFNAAFKFHQFECDRCGGVIKFEQRNVFDSDHLLVTSMRQNMVLKIPSNHYIRHHCEINSPEQIKPCCILTGSVYEEFLKYLITDQNKKETNDKNDDDFFVLQFSSFQYMFLRMMTYIKSSLCLGQNILRELGSTS